MKKYLLPFVVFFVNYLCLPGVAEAQQTGMFLKQLDIDGSPCNVAYFVPEDYDSEKSYPLIVGMSPGGGPGVMMRDMLFPVTEQKDIIIACPDFHGSSPGPAPHVIKSVKEEYNIDGEKVILTGYSAGGAAVFPYGADYPEEVRGVIGIAPSIGGVDYENCNNRAFAIICGTLDGTMGAARQLQKGILEHGGGFLLIEKEGVAHTGPYFGSIEFIEDWIKCYDFIMDYQPRPRVKPIAPKRGEYGPESPIQLVWTSIKGADYYEVYVYDFTKTYVIETTTDTTFTLPDLTPYQTFSWRIRHYKDGKAGDWSYKWNFTTKALKPTGTPIPLFPENGQINVQQYTVLRWKAVAGLMHYHIQISDDDFKTMFYEDSAYQDYNNNEVMFRKNEPFEAATTYKWRVRAANPEGFGPWSEIFTFTTNDPYVKSDDDQVTLIRPDSGKYAPPVPVKLEWNGYKDARYYEIELSDEKFVLLSHKTTTKEYILEGLEVNKVYYWRVRHANDDKICTWSQKWSFRTKAHAPTEAPVLLIPEDETTNVSLFIVLRWELIDDADYYELEVSNDQFETFFKLDTVTGPFYGDFVTYTNLRDLDSNKMYYWRVRGGNPEGVGPWSDVFRFATYDADMAVSETVVKPGGFNSDVYPNPTEGKFEIRFDMKAPGIVSINLFNATGNIVAKLFRGYAEAGENRKPVQLNDIPHGLYFYEIKTGMNIEFGRVIISK